MKEYSCTINLGFLLKCVTTRSFTFRKGPRTPAFKFSHLYGGMVAGIIYNILCNELCKTRVLIGLEECVIRV